MNLGHCLCWHNQTFPTSARTLSNLSEHNSSNSMAGTCSELGKSPGTNFPGFSIFSLDFQVHPDKKKAGDLNWDGTMLGPNIGWECTPVLKGQTSNASSEVPEPLKKRHMGSACVERDQCHFFVINPCLTWLVGGIPTPLKNMKVKWDDYSQYMEK